MQRHTRPTERQRPAGMQRHTRPTQRQRLAGFGDPALQGQETSSCPTKERPAGSGDPALEWLLDPDGAVAEQLLDGVGELLAPGDEEGGAEAEAAFMLSHVDVNEHLGVAVELADHLP